MLDYEQSYEFKFLVFILMKVLFVYPRLSAKSSGGIQCSKRNYKALVQIFGEENIISYPVEQKHNRMLIKKVMNHVFELGFGGLDKSVKKEVVEIINTEHIKYVHIDSSSFGSLTKYIREQNCNVKVVTFFHNVEYDFVKSTLPPSLKGILMSYRLPLIKLAEKYSLKFSNICISLHKKDSERIEELYGKSPNYEIPITLNDVKAKFCTEKTYNNRLRLLFFGANFKPNIDAVDILVNEILPNVEEQVELLIAGDGMDKIANIYRNCANVTVKGFVEDIDSMYNWADIVVLPIFSGAGMKVKTAEALLYGKNIIASDVALDGYCVDNVPGIVRCTKIDDFVKTLNTWDKTLPRFNIGARKLYENCYSYDVSFRMFQKVYLSLNTM